MPQFLGQISFNQMAPFTHPAVYKLLHAFHSSQGCNDSCNMLGRRQNVDIRSCICSRICGYPFCSKSGYPVEDIMGGLQPVVEGRYCLKTDLSEKIVFCFVKCA